MKNQPFWDAYRELERQCHGMLTEMRNAGENLEGADLTAALEEISVRYGMGVDA